MAKAYAPTATADEVPSLVTPTPTRLVGSYQTCWSLKGTVIILPDFSAKRMQSLTSSRLKASVSMRGTTLPFTL